jgi:hypothetical protein
MNLEEQIFSFLQYCYSPVRQRNSQFHHVTTDIQYLHDSVFVCVYIDIYIYIHIYISIYICI